MASSREPLEQKTANAEFNYRGVILMHVILVTCFACMIGTIAFGYPKLAGAAILLTVNGTAMLYIWKPSLAMNLYPEKFAWRNPSSLRGARRLAIFTPVVGLLFSIGFLYAVVSSR